MKKILIGVFVLTLLSATTLTDNGKHPKKGKAKATCGMNCPTTRDCKPTAKCPNKPGCICQ